MGARAYVDGPYGVFTVERNEGPHFVVVAGGVGVTPVMSILRTLADRKDRRPVLLVYASGSWEEVTFREKIEQLQHRLDLAVVHVLEDAYEGWWGETGFVDAEMIERHLPPRVERGLVFVCGPEPMNGGRRDRRRGRPWHADGAHRHGALHLRRVIGAAACATPSPRAWSSPSRHCCRQPASCSPLPPADRGSHSVATLPRRARRRAARPDPSRS